MQVPVFLNYTWRIAECNTRRNPGEIRIYRNDTKNSLVKILGWNLTHVAVIVCYHIKYYFL